VPDIAELLTADLHRVFGNRDAVSRRAAVEETYAADVVVVVDGRITELRTALAS
jgi:hypothetical protein